MAADLPGPVLGLRLLALAVVAGSGAFLPIPTRAPLIAGILGGAAVGFAQYAAARRRLRVPGALFVIAHVAVWTYLVHVTGGPRSPLFVGYLLEIPLAAALHSRRGCATAAAVGAFAYVLMAALLHPPLAIADAALATGFLAVTAALSWLVVDVLERQRRQIAATQAALRARAESLAEELRLLGDYLNGALVGVDDTGRVASVNGPGLDLLGTTRALAVGRPWQEVLRPDPESAGRLARAVADGSPRRALRVRLGGPPPIEVQADVWVGPSEDGRRTYLLLAAAAPPPGADDDPMRRLGEAVACVSHQIKNSLHALQGLAEGIERDLGGSERAESARQFIEALRGLGELSENVLALSGAPRPAGETVPLGEALSSAAVLARHRSGRVRVDLPACGVHVRGHRGRLVHALFNLLDNACRASPPGGAVAVAVRVTAGRAVVEIADAGPGLPPGLDGARGRAASRDGSGYGVLAARRFLEAGGGTLDFSAAPDGGTVCRVSLPAAETPAAREEAS